MLAIDATNCRYLFRICCHHSSTLFRPSMRRASRALAVILAASIHSLFIHTIHPFPGTTRISLLLLHHCIIKTLPLHPSGCRTRHLLLPPGAVHLSTVYPRLFLYPYYPLIRRIPFSLILPCCCTVRPSIRHRPSTTITIQSIHIALPPIARLPPPQHCHSDFCCRLLPPSVCIIAQFFAPYSHLYHLTSSVSSIQLSHLSIYHHSIAFAYRHPFQLRPSRPGSFPSIQLLPFAAVCHCIASRRPGSRWRCRHLRRAASKPTLHRHQAIVCRRDHLASICYLTGSSRHSAAALPRPATAGIAAALPFIALFAAAALSGCCLNFAAAAALLLL